MKELDFKNKINLLLYIFVISGVFGFIYETVFYKLDLGYFVKRGSTFGPWIPIYAFGGVLIFLLTCRVNKKPLLVFIISMFISGILEYLTGYILFNTFHVRLWDYNVEILNFGNIGGFICLRSVLFFGLSGLFLTYMIVPFVKKHLIFKRYSLTISIVLSSLFLIDILSYIIIK